jgi:hypothetical protein
MTAFDGTVNAPLTMTPSPMTTLSKESAGFAILAPSTDLNKDQM